MSRELIAYLPDFYAGSPQVSALQGALDRQTQALWTAEGGLIDQLDVSKATWGLAYWEKSLGLETDLEKMAVRKGVITKEQYQEITGESYT